jgi:hypothetical protein
MRCRRGRCPSASHHFISDDSAIADDVIADAAIADSVVTDPVVADAPIAGTVINDTAIADTVIPYAAIADAVVACFAIGDSGKADSRWWGGRQEGGGGVCEREGMCVYVFIREMPAWWQAWHADWMRGEAKAVRLQRRQRRRGGESTGKGGNRRSNKEWLALDEFQASCTMSRRLGGEEVKLTKKDFSWVPDRVRQINQE